MEKEKLLIFGGPHSAKKLIVAFGNAIIFAIKLSPGDSENIAVVSLVLKYKLSITKKNKMSPLSVLYVNFLH